MHGSQRGGEGVTGRGREGEGVRWRQGRKDCNVGKRRKRGHLAGEEGVGWGGGGVRGFAYMPGVCLSSIRPLRGDDVCMCTYMCMRMCICTLVHTCACVCVFVHLPRCDTLSHARTHTHSLTHSHTCIVHVCADK
jgi:hypothetical protein